ncbi:TDT family transporter [Desulfovibrio cuneatus]|uniref:TDT family transporter n=1 Tax=Desulfovibrio cuneatus TaxID=159728 RepID=UPI0004268679|nr:TDT family transporter [Desulfovibrio cuneatus]
MWQFFRTHCAFIPTPLAGLALGIASLGLGLENTLPLHSVGQGLGAIVASCLLLCLASKFTLHPHIIWQELRHPVLGSILPTFSMGLMLVSKALSMLHAGAGQAMWLFAVALHLVFMVVFGWHRLRALDLQQMVPSWFVPFVGIILAAVTFPAPHYAPLAKALLYFGMLAYALLLPVMVYRLMFMREVADAAKPTLAIMAAPASLSLTGYLMIEPEPSLLLCAVLLGLALLMTCAIYLAFFKLLRLPFSPGFAAFTFPMAVGASALYRVALHLEAYPMAARYVAQLRTLAVAETVVATLIVGYVCLRYALYYARPGGFLEHTMLRLWAGVCGHGWHLSTAGSGGKKMK